MRIPVPKEVTSEEQVQQYCHAYREGYLDLERPSRMYQRPGNQHPRDLWPEAYDAGQSAAFKFLNKAWAWKK